MPLAPNGKEITMPDQPMHHTPPAAADLSEEEEEFALLVERAFIDEWFAEAHAVESDEGRVILQGEVDTSALEDLDQVMSELEDAHPASLRIDLSQATFVSTAAMLRIIDSASHVGQVTVSGANMTVRRIFAVLDAERRCELVD